MTEAGTNGEFNHIKGVTSALIFTAQLMNKLSAAYRICVIQQALEVHLISIST